MRKLKTGDTIRFIQSTQWFVEGQIVNVVVGPVSDPESGPNVQSIADGILITGPDVLFDHVEGTHWEFVEPEATGQ